MSLDEAPLEEIACGRARRGERHPAHVWLLQFSDDSPAEGLAWCAGLAVEGKPQ